MKDRDISENKRILKHQLLSLQDKDIKNPYCSSELISAVPAPLIITDRFNRSHKSVYVLNNHYVSDKEEITDVPGISQESFQFGNNEDESFVGSGDDNRSDCNGDISNNKNAYKSLIPSCRKNMNRVLCSTLSKLSTFQS